MDAVEVLAHLNSTDITLPRRAAPRFETASEAFWLKAVIYGRVLGALIGGSAALFVLTHILRGDTVIIVLAIFFLIALKAAHRNGLVVTRGRAFGLFVLTLVLAYLIQLPVGYFVIGPAIGAYVMPANHAQAITVASLLLGVAVCAVMPRFVLRLEHRRSRTKAVDAAAQTSVVTTGENALTIVAALIVLVLSSPLMPGGNSVTRDVLIVASYFWCAYWTIKRAREQGRSIWFWAVPALLCPPIAAGILACLKPVRPPPIVLSAPGA